MPTDDQLATYADVAVRVGLALDEGDRLLIASSIEAVDLTRAIVEQAYAAGAANVTVLWGDDEIDRARFTSGRVDAAEVVSSETHARMAAFDAGDHFLTVMARDPDAMAGIDAAALAGFQQVNQEAAMPMIQVLSRLQRKWSVVAAPSAAWADKVFPGDPDAVEKLWQAIFRACRADVDDPVEAWRDHTRELNARASHLTSRRYVGLRYQAPGTDLRLGLPDGTVWQGGSVEGGFVPNIPTEEVFCAPHRLRGEGTVAATKPLSLYGQLVHDFAFELSDGRIVSATAGEGQDVIDELLARDDGSARFGEAAMVPMSSAVAAEQLVWNNTLYDENDGCHIAIGRAYPVCVEGGPELSPDELTEAGLNASAVHVDFVVGSDQLDVFGVRADGGEEPIITAGEWGFSV